eukprot:2945442-Rhodomonas_salina.2
MPPQIGRRGRSARRHSAGTRPAVSSYAPAMRCPLSSCPPAMRCPLSCYASAMRCPLSSYTAILLRMCHTPLLCCCAMCHGTEAGSTGGADSYVELLCRRERRGHPG